LVKLKTRVEGFGLQLSAIENVHRHWNDKIKLGLPGRDEQIENWCTTLRNMGRADVPILGYNFMTPSSPTSYSWSTSRTPTARGGAEARVFDWEVAKNAPTNDLGEFDDDQIWGAFEYFIKAVTPVAEESGVKLALHPYIPQSRLLAETMRPCAQ
jgi:mannonate dehydratase